MPVDIKVLGQQASPLDRIAAAVQIAKGLKGMEVDSQTLDRARQEAAQKDTTFKNQQTEFGQKQDLYTKQNDPNSVESKNARSVLLAHVASNPKIDPQAKSALLSVANNPNATAQQINEVSSSPLLKQDTTLAGKELGVAALISGLDARNKFSERRNDRADNQAYSKELSPYENTIMSANRAQEIISKIKSGELKSTPTLRNDLNAALGSMFNNGKGATVYGMSHSDQSSLEGRINAGLGYVTGTAQDTIPESMLDQLDKDVSSLKGAFLEGHRQKYESFREGLSPDAVEKLNNRFNKFRETAGAMHAGQQAGQAAEIVPGVSQDAVAAEIARRKSLKKGS